MFLCLLCLHCTSLVTCEITEYHHFIDWFSVCSFMEALKCYVRYNADVDFSSVFIVLKSFFNRDISCMWYK